MIYSFSIQFNRNYGINHGTGWSVVINGITMCQFEPCLLTCLPVAIWRFYAHKLYEF